MTKVIAINKMSKKAQREYYAKQRNGWNGLSPVTRVPSRPGAYNRQQQKKKIKEEYYC